MDNKQIARILRDTAQLLEIDGAIIGRYRSYEKAAELIDSLPESVEQLVKEPEKLEELPGIGERMVEQLQEIGETGDYSLRKELLEKISGDDSGRAAIAIAGTEESGFPVVEFQGGHGSGRREAGKGAKAARRARVWRKKR